MQAKKNPKVSISRNSIFFFQIGLIIVLGAVYFGLEWKTLEKNVAQNYQVQVDEELTEDIPITQMNTPPPPPPPPAPVIPELITVVDNELDIEEDDIKSTETSQDDKIENVKEVEDINETGNAEEEEIADVPFVMVEDVPIFPGCENLKDNDARKACMAEKIDRFVKKEFNNELGAELGLYGINRIIVVFKIDKNGNITDIKTRGPHKKLEEEAKRVVKKLPKVIPGKQRNRPVGVIYSLPIVFQIREP
ncbi:energy transducer TonB [Zunongwangia sp.]|uniref:energy transducer TonB n=1 Tax=Zunongwangia sp. TaxID=1965325 RepID=UPI003AA814FE